MNGSPDLTGQWLNFAQQPVDQGGLGLAPHQAAGLVGNLVNESGRGLSAWGPTGDNGTAWGTAQWRGDRLNALKSMFPDNYQTPQAQMQFMRHEMMGSENRAYKALLTAKTPEEAATAVNRLYERSADTTGNREKAARQLMAQFGGAGGASPALAFSGDDEEGGGDAPAALSANSTMGKGALQNIMPAVEKESGGKHRISSGLIGMAAALASISSPQQAYALSGIAKQLKDSDADEKVTYKTIVGKDGRILRVGSNGQVDAYGASPAGANDGTAQAPQMAPTWGDDKLLGDDPTKASPEAQEAYLKSMQGSQAEMVRGLIDNTLPAPTAAALSKKDSPYPAAFAAARKIDPTLDPNTYAGRVAGYRDWATKGAESARALNQTIAHQSEALIGAMKGLNNGDSPIVNEVKNWWSENVNGSGSVPGFRTSAHAVVDELGKVFKQNNLSDTEIRKWEENLPAKMSPEQQRMQIRVFGQLMHGAMQALEDKRKQAIGPHAAAKARPLLSDEGARGLKALQDFATEPASKKSGAPAIDHDAIDAELKRRGL
ncbi:phage tail tip lysozyme [Bradyrhizobium lupini]|uniref:phage tail tip lysozyme n=1 Tax=Rhizobium lupini TaxID=136996 RepID=UPI0034C5E558